MLKTVVSHRRIGRCRGRGRDTSGMRARWGETALYEQACLSVFQWVNPYWHALLHKWQWKPLAQSVINLAWGGAERWSDRSGTEGPSIQRLRVSTTMLSHDWAVSITQPNFDCGVSTILLSHKLNIEFHCLCDDNDRAPLTFHWVVPTTPLSHDSALQRFCWAMTQWHRWALSLISVISDIGLSLISELPISDWESGVRHYIGYRNKVFSDIQYPISWSSQTVTIA